MVGMVMNWHRCGTLLRASLYDMLDDSRGDGSLKDCVAGADGKVHLCFGDQVRIVVADVAGSLSRCQHAPEMGWHVRTTDRLYSLSEFPGGYLR